MYTSVYVHIELRDAGLFRQLDPPQSLCVYIYMYTYVSVHAHSMYICVTLISAPHTENSSVDNPYIALRLRPRMRQPRSPRAAPWSTQRPAFGATGRTRLALGLNMHDALCMSALIPSCPTRLLISLAILFQIKISVLDASRDTQEDESWKPWEQEAIHEVGSVSHRSPNDTLLIVLRLRRLWRPLIWILRAPVLPDDVASSADAW